MENKQHLAISVLQPSASFLVRGVRGCDTFRFKPGSGKLKLLEQNGNRLLIHASARKDKNSRYACQLNAAVKSQMQEDFDSLPFGLIIGHVEVVDFINTSSTGAVEEIRAALGYNADRMALEVDLGDFAPDRWAWIYKNPVQYANPFQAGGSPGIWELSDHYFKTFYNG